MIIKNSINMKKSYYLLLACASLLFSCNPGGGGETPDPAGTTYPRVQLIEHFTGESCGYCPYGMNLIYEAYSVNPDGYVWISNHTYYTDEYSIDESFTIAKKLGVTGAPVVSLNRERYSGSRCMHPYDMLSFIPQQATTATSTVSLTRTYDAATRELKITASGKTSETNIDSVMLTVAVTESGLVGPQADNFFSWDGWKKFRHTHAVRLYASQALGDEVKMKNRTFSKEYTVTLKENWNPDNCEIVAWITANNSHWPVLNAAKLPVVEGTKGGEDIVHGGIEEYPVPETYPEQGTPSAEVRLTGCEALIRDMSAFTLIDMIVYNTDSAVTTLSGTKMYAFYEVYLLVPANSTTVPVGTYTLKEEANAGIGDAIAGKRNDEKHSVDGSVFYWIYKNGSDYYYGREWMLVSGNIVVTEEGVEITATTKNGSPLHATFTGAITLQKGSGAPLRIAKRPDPTL